MTPGPTQLARRTGGRLRLAAPHGRSRRFRDPAGKFALLNRRLLLGLALIVLTPILLLVGYVAHLVFVDVARSYLVYWVQWGTLQDEREFERRMLEVKSRMLERGNKEDLKLLPPVRPFQEVTTLLDEDALDWGAETTTGILAFDANGDGRMDLFLPQMNSNAHRPTDENGILLDGPRRQHCALYINEGNDENGLPRLTQAKVLARRNPTHSREELLVENYLYARESPDAPEGGECRLALVAAAADLNADGRLDLLVGNGLPGMLMSSPETQYILTPFVSPAGRTEHVIGPRLAHPWIGFLKDYVARIDLDETRATGRGTEPVGANSIFLNMGDQDGDGLPEWKDATHETGLGGRRNTMGLVVADFDLDGDLDVFESNSGDPDVWPGGARELGGGANQLYLNQLAETGKLTFVQKAEEMNVDGVYDEDRPPPRFRKLARIPLLPLEYSLALSWWREFTPGFLSLQGRESEHAEVSWAATAQDVNDDGYPDLWVANDFTYLRLHINQAGQRFEEPPRFVQRDRVGNWMSFCPADFNGDLEEDLLVANLGGTGLNMALSRPGQADFMNPSISILGVINQRWFGYHTTMHTLVDGRDFTRELPHRVTHSHVLPPDMALPNNVRSYTPKMLPDATYNPESLDAFEFSWANPPLDVQNDGRMDVYWVGGLFTRGGGIFPVTATNPGRLLINSTPDPDNLRFIDLTAEYHVFNIHELQYDRLESDGIVYRKSPSQNWGRRSVVSSNDLSVWGLIGPHVNDKVAHHDLIQTAENGHGVVTPDLNGDGFADLIVRNAGGFHSRSSTATNLKARIDGKVVVVPPADPNLPAPTNFEPGSTRIFINTHGQHPDANYWLALDLRDDTPGALNTYAVGARVVVDGRASRTRRVGAQFTSNTFGPLLFGLGRDRARRVEVHWPDKERTVTRYDLGALKNVRVTLKKSGNVQIED